MNFLFPAKLVGPKIELSAAENNQAQQNISAALLAAKGHLLDEAKVTGLGLDTITTCEAQGDIVAQADIKSKQIQINYTFVLRAPPEQLLIVFVHELYISFILRDPKKRYSV